MIRIRTILIACILLSADVLLPVSGQEVSPYETFAVQKSIYGYIEEVSSIADKIAHVSLSKLPSLERNLEAVNFRWEAYLETEQLVIVGDERLMNDMSRYQSLYLAVTDSLANRRVTLVAMADFKTAETYISSVVPEYQNIYDKALKLSLVKQTAAQLAKLKVEEQVLFQKVQQAYQKAQGAAAVAPSLSKKEKALEDQMSDLVMKSEKIQAMEFKPWLDRIKDYLMSLAAVAMILMFISTVKSKWAAIKAQKDAAQKYKDALNNDEYPTI